MFREEGLMVVIILVEKEDMIEEVVVVEVEEVGIIEKVGILGLARVLGIEIAGGDDTPSLTDYYKSNEVHQRCI